MIRIRDGAVLDDKQKKVIFNIQPFTVGMDLEVTRGHDSARGQVRTIAKFALKNGIHFPEFDPELPDLAMVVDIPVYGRLYTWQRTWSKLLELGVVINPPMDAVCLFPYTRPSGEQMQGKVIKASPHITGDPIDFSARVNGIPNIAMVTGIMTRAKAAGAGIRAIKPEPKNGCVHIDLDKDVDSGA